MVDQLIDILGREASLFESFLELLEQQQRALVDNNVERLNHVTEQQREMLSKSKLLHREREAVIEDIKRHNVIDGDLTVTRLLEMVDQSQADQLSQLRDAILNVNDRILKTRNQNAILLNKSRDYIGRMMKMFSRIGDPSPVYNSGGDEQEAKHNLAVDRRA
ncbi:MAG: flagellar protein FlgN [candidate division Zixibacteria bacterium]|nr:flagellar protein FlgN [candidate division Zixibacteria bacterium]